MAGLPAKWPVAMLLLALAVPSQAARPMEKIDANADGYLSLDEFLTGIKNDRIQGMKQTFTRRDQDGDGRLSAAEFNDSSTIKAKGKKKSTKKSNAEKPAKTQTAKASAKPSSKANPAKVSEFKELDFNGDNKLSIDEFIAFTPIAKRGNRRDLFSSRDRNKDTFISRSEFMK